MASCFSTCSTISAKSEGDVRRRPQVNGMPIIASKCKIMYFYRGNSPTSSRYNADGTDLELVDYRSRISASSSTKRCLLKNICEQRLQEFTDTQTSKCLYVFLVCSTLEYGLQGWASRQIRDINLLERVQKTATRIILCRLPIEHPARLLYNE